MPLHRLSPQDDFGPVLALLRSAFAGMEGRISPPSSLHHLTPEAIAQAADVTEVWAIGTPPRACVFLTPRPDCLYIGKLAVAATARRTGLARRLIALAEDRARAHNLSRLELQTRVELTENHASFAALGFTETGRTTHPGFDRTTSITFCKNL